MGLELDVWTDGGTESNMVVDLAIDSEDDFFVVADEGLGTGV